jgi:hypothetical protein
MSTPTILEDVLCVARFIVDEFPMYEDAISWDDDVKIDDYEWGRAAKRLLANASATGAAQPRNGSPGFWNS